MKLPWNSSKDSDKSSNPTYIEKMPEEQKQKQEPILTLDGKRYDLKSLPDEIKDILGKMRVADQQVRMHEDTVRVLSIGRQTLGLTLKEKIKDITPLPENS